MMKIVYVLVADRQNYIAEMCALSAASAKRYTPNIRCCAVLDAWTLQFLREERPFLLEDIDETIVVDRIHEDAVRMSRHIKTSLRNLVPGDFLFMDTDAIPVQDISELGRLECDFAATQNGNCHPAKHIMGEAETEIFEAMDWPVSPGYFLNAGVFYAKDSAPVRQLFARWHALWQESSAKGFNKDQPALNVAVTQAPIGFQLLPAKWNAMISLYSGGSFRPKIVHFSTIKFDQRNDTIFHDMIRRIRIDRKVDLGPLELARKRQFYWTDQDSVFYQLKTGNVDKAIANAVRRLLKGRPLDIQAAE